MKQNKYDDMVFFDKYRAMDRSTRGLAGAGEWPALKKLLPDFKGKAVLDLGCGFGWHCAYALEQGAGQAVGVDISCRMLAEGRRKFPAVEFIEQPIEDVPFPEKSFDITVVRLSGHKKVQNHHELWYGWVAQPHTVQGDFGLGSP